MPHVANRRFIWACRLEINVKTIQRILCPTDFSSTAEKAVKYAEQLAIEADAELTLMHSFEIPATWSRAGQTHPLDADLEEQLNATLAGSPHEAKIHRLQHAGLSGEVICWMAQDRGCDLIVMGTHGRTGLRHLLFGSVAEYVLRHARCPVVTIRDRDPKEPLLVEPIIMPPPTPVMS